MIIKNLEIKNLYHAINLTANFQDGINLLVGINGSGKTSALNAISWLLQPSIPNLVTVQFDEIKLRCEKDGVAVTIRAKRTKKTLRIYLQVGKKIYKSLHIPMRHDPDDIYARLEDLDEIKKLYESLGPTEEETPTWNFFQTLTKPTVISLDRNLTIQNTETISVEYGRKGLLRNREAREITPIARVSSITNSQYVNYKNVLISLNEQLKENILLSSFETHGLNTKKTSIPTLGEIEALENKVLQHLSQWIKDKAAHNKISEYFKQLKTAAKKVSLLSEKSSVLIFGGMYQKELTRLNELATAFNLYESKSSEALQTITKYLEVVNHFLADSGKKLEFDNAKNQLQFCFINSKKEKLGEFRQIENLSSGERQILILMTYVCFPPNKESLLIIDEPELSLHPKWQRDFISSVNSLMPLGNQIILATHSPEIVGRNREKCIVLNHIEV